MASALEADAQKNKVAQTVIDTVQIFYMQKIRPLEEKYWFGDFHTTPLLTEADFEARPMVLLLGQYSVGKTSFIRYLLERDHSSLRVGPEPVTDRFLAVMEGKTDRVVPGNVAVLQKDKPFVGLADRYGMQFLSKFECLEMDSPILRKISLIDTPGVLAGAKQVEKRGYNMARVVRWFAERCDRVLLLFDAHKLDISDEMKAVMRALEGNHGKVRIVLNKADNITSKQLMRVYGALMWSLGRVIEAPESLRVYIGSFWERPMQKREFSQFMREERSELLQDLASLPRQSTLRRITELIKRCRYFKVHMTILRHLRPMFRMVMMKKKKQAEIQKSLFSEFRRISAEQSIPAKDFPDVNAFRKKLDNHYIWKLPSTKTMDFDFKQLDICISYEIPEIMKTLDAQVQAAPKRTHAPPNFSDVPDPVPASSPPVPKMQTASRADPVPKVVEPAPVEQPKPRPKPRPKPEAKERPVPKPSPKPKKKKSKKKSKAQAAAAPAPRVDRKTRDAPAESDDGLSWATGAAPAGGAEPGEQDDAWVVSDAMRDRCYALFDTLDTEEDKLSGLKARETLLKSGLSVEDLRVIWNLSDIDEDGSLDRDEFCLCMYLIDSKRRGRMDTLPTELPIELVPPSKRAV